MIDLKEIDFNESTLEIFEKRGNDVVLKISDIYDTPGVVEVYITCKDVYSIRVEGEQNEIGMHHEHGDIIFLEIISNTLEMLVSWIDFKREFVDQSITFMYQISYKKIESTVVEGNNERPR